MCHSRGVRAILNSADRGGSANAGLVREHLNIAAVRGEKDLDKITMVPERSYDCFMIVVLVSSIYRKVANFYFFYRLFSVSYLMKRTG